MKYDVMLTIYVPTYNHEKYISQALDSILMQKTNYKYEVLVGEDCSTDNTRMILEKYEENYPGVFTVFYRERNMYSLKPNNTDDLKMRAKGKYIICLEGDDFWTDDNKIERQITFLEQNPQYIAVSHKCQMVDKDGVELNTKFPECQENEYTIQHFYKGIYPGQTTTFMIRNYVLENLFDTSLLFDSCGPGDRRLYFSAICCGRIYCLDEIMSAYRYVTSEGSSFSAKYNAYNFNSLERASKDFLRYARKNANVSTIKYMEMFYLKELLKGLKMKSISLGETPKYIREIKYPFSDVMLLVKQKMYEICKKRRRSIT